MITKPILNAMESAYLWIFRRPAFRRLNERVLRTVLRSLGILNSENSQVSGEESFITCLARIIPQTETPTIIDVGAHHGDYATSLCQAIPYARIYAFEPNPTSFERLRTAIRNSGNSHPVNAAVGEHSGEVTLYDYEAADGSQHASVVKGIIEGLHGGQSRAFQVEQITLDKFLEREKIGWVDLLKIDVEGNELNVLLGGRQALQNRSIGIIQFEFNEMNKSSKVFFQDFAELLSDYKLFRLLPKGMIGIASRPYLSYQTEIFAFQNIIAILRGSVYENALAINCR